MLGTWFWIGSFQLDRALTLAGVTDDVGDAGMRWVDDDDVAAATGSSLEGLARHAIE